MLLGCDDDYVCCMGELCGAGPKEDECAIIPEYNWWVLCTDVDLAVYCCTAGVCCSPITFCIVPGRTLSAIPNTRSCEQHCLVNCALFSLSGSFPLCCICCLNYNATTLYKARKYHKIKGMKCTDYLMHICICCLPFVWADLMARTGNFPHCMASGPSIRKASMGGRPGLAEHQAPGKDSSDKDVDDLLSVDAKDPLSVLGKDPLSVDSLFPLDEAELAVGLVA